MQQAYQLDLLVISLFLHKNYNLDDLFDMKLNIDLGNNCYL